MLKAARQATKGRVIAVHQPHRYTRLRDLFTQFCACFNDADTVAIADVYSAGEPPIEGVSRDTLVGGLIAPRPPPRAAARRRGGAGATSCAPSAGRATCWSASARARSAPGRTRCRRGWARTNGREGRGVSEAWLRSPSGRDRQQRRAMRGALRRGALGASVRFAAACRQGAAVPRRFCAGAGAAGCARAAVDLGGGEERGDARPRCRRCAGR